MVKGLFRWLATSLKPIPSRDDFILVWVTQGPALGYTQSFMLSSEEDLRTLGALLSTSVVTISTDDMQRLSRAGLVNKQSGKLELPESSTPQQMEFVFTFHKGDSDE